MSDAQKCSARVRIKGLNWPGYLECDAAGKVVRDGKPYCGRHDPDRLARIENEKRARQRAETDYKTWVSNMNEATLGIARAVLLVDDTAPLPPIVKEAVAKYREIQARMP